MLNSHQKDASPIFGDEEFIDLSKIFTTIKHQWLIIFACVLLALIAATVLWAITPSKWQASTQLQVGQMPTSTSARESISVALIEPPAQAAARLDQRELEDRALTVLNLPIDEVSDKRSSLFRSSLKATVVKNTNFLEVNLAAYSAEDARKYLSAATQALIDVHNKRMGPVLKNIEIRVKENTLQMTEAQTQLTHLQEMLKNAGHPKSDGQFAPHIVAADLISKQNEKILHLTTEQMALVDSLLPSNTYPTSVLDAIYVPSTPYFPKLSIFLALGLLLGLGAGIALALLRDHPIKLINGN